jgi:hypothetical protein
MCCVAVNHYEKLNREEFECLERVDSVSLGALHSVYQWGVVSRFDDVAASLPRQMAAKAASASN